MRGAIRSLQRGHRTAGPRQIVISAAGFDGPPTLAMSVAMASPPNATAHRPEDSQDNADHQPDDADRPQEPDLRDEPGNAGRPKSS
jgi:hypothetical protein